MLEMKRASAPTATGRSATKSALAMLAMLKTAAAPIAAEVGWLLQLGVGLEVSVEGDATRALCVDAVDREASCNSRITSLRFFNLAPRTIALTIWILPHWQTRITAIIADVENAMGSIPPKAKASCILGM